LVGVLLGLRSLGDPTRGEESQFLTSHSAWISNRHGLVVFGCRGVGDSGDVLVDKETQQKVRAIVRRRNKRMRQEWERRMRAEAQARVIGSIVLVILVLIVFRMGL
jgi:redox-regulated HSP33 family molecular chaperone